MATQEEIRVGSIVQFQTRRLGITACGIVLAYPSLVQRGLQPGGQADVYWFKEKITDWEYISYLEVLVR